MPQGENPPLHVLHPRGEEQGTKHYPSGTTSPDKQDDISALSVQQHPQVMTVSHSVSSDEDPKETQLLISALSAPPPHQMQLCPH